jgi:hypothetical protein
VPDEAQPRAEILHLVTGSARLRQDGCRIVVLSELATAVLIAELLPRSTVILLTQAQASAIQDTSAGHPPNLEILSCSLAGAQFLPESISAVISTRGHEAVWGHSANVQIVAQWLESGGPLLIEARPASRWRWLLANQSHDLVALAKAVGLEPDPAAATGLQVYWKDHCPLYTVEPRDGIVAR